MIAYEIEPDIAERAVANLARYPQVEVRARSGVDDLPAADAIHRQRRRHASPSRLARRAQARRKARLSLSRRRARPAPCSS